MSDTFKAIHAYGGREHEKEGPRVGCLLCELEALAARVRELECAIEDYLLWRPGERGHAEAHRKLHAALTPEEPKT